ncbi:MAG: serine protease [Lachnospiraceae bacterium]|nr:serine protease [Lachnospiraceae bacterium]
METLTTVGIILLIAGFILVGIEMTIPGFGVSGISGIACLVGGILLTARNVEQGLTITVIVVVILAVMLTIAMILLKRVKAPFVLEDSLKAEAGFLNASDLEYLVGKEGVASSDLKPAGKCSIEGVEFDVRAEMRYIERGTKVQISRIRENTIMVKEI